jgi:hypothetical protein
MPTSPQSQIQTSSTPWSVTELITCRFTFLYFTLFCTPIPGQTSIFQVIPHVGDAIHNAAAIPLSAAALWVGHFIFHLQGEAATWHSTGSGDTALHWATYFCILILSILGAIVWSILDRARTNYNTALAWLYVLIRFTLAFAMLDYGFSKIYPHQFAPPNLDVLNETYGASTPMRLMWTFMGSSTLYRISAGAAEVLAGLLLMFRWTGTLGALLTAAVMANVAVLNFSYDVPVKLYSTHLCAAAVFLLIPDLHAMFRFFLQRREATLSRPWLPLSENPTLRRATKILHAVVVLFALLTYGVGVYESTPTPRRPNADNFPLLSHTLHWISPTPLNQ